MTKPAGLALAMLLFAVLATANSGGYRYGVSDQAFYAPAVALEADPSLFARDRVLLEPQMRLWIGDEWLGALARATGGRLPLLFAALYAITLLTLALAGVALARSLGCGWWTIAAFLILLTLRHRIARTGANSLEGYFHPRMLAFALGLFALAAVAHARLARATLWTILAAVVHTTTAIWFGAAVVVAAWWPWARGRHAGLAWAGALATLTVPLVAASLLVPDRIVTMDAAWLAVLGDKDYLFPADWPAYAWITNLAAPVIVLAVHRARVRQQVTARGEDSLVAGLLALVVLFAVSVPLTEWRWAWVVQLQVNRVFWLLDAAAILYLAWWLARFPARRTIVLTLLLLAAIRGFYVVHLEAERPLARLDLPNDDWTDAMRWLRAQPKSWHVLADPGHGWKYGSSVRVAAERDTLLETGKDTAFAMYDRAIAMRVADRIEATAAYDNVTRDDISRLDARFELDVMVDRADRSFALPVLYRNASFVVYDLR